jgi:hypothetical protein
MNRVDGDPGAVVSRDGKLYLKGTMPSDADPLDLAYMRRTAIASLETLYPASEIRQIQIGIETYRNMGVPHLVSENAIADDLRSHIPPRYDRVFLWAWHRFAGNDQRPGAGIGRLRLLASGWSPGPRPYCGAFTTGADGGSQWAVRELPSVARAVASILSIEVGNPSLLVSWIYTGGPTPWWPWLAISAAAIAAIVVIYALVQFIPYFARPLAPLAMIVAAGHARGWVSACASAAFLVAAWALIRRRMNRGSSGQEAIEISLPLASGV